MITLGSVTLDENLLLDGADQRPRIIGSQRWSLEGSLIINSAPIINGYLLSLAADDRGGYFTRQQIIDVRALQTIGDPVGLEYNGQYSLTVLIIDPISFVELKKYNVHQADDIGLGAIPLREV